jgi:hypothetical protein
MIGIIVTLEEDGDQDEVSTHLASIATPGSQLVRWDVLGLSVLDRFFQTLQNISPQDVAFLPDSANNSGTADSYSSSSGNVNNRFSRWEEAAHNFLSQGVKTLLLVKLDHYINIDLADFVKFHYATASKLTQVFHGSQPISIVLAEASELRGKGVSLRRQLANTIPQRRRYQFNSYFKPLKNLDQFHQLSQDALARRCQLQPLGQEISQNIWAGDEAFIHPTAHISGPAYVGAHTMVDAGCALGRNVVIERDCEIDCGTTLEDCSITHNTYAGPGLNFKNAIAGPGWLYSLEHRTTISIHDPNLLGSTHSNSLLNRAKSFLSSSWRARDARSTFFSQTASLYAPSRMAGARPPLAGHFKFDRLPQASNEENPSR